MTKSILNNSCKVKINTKLMENYTEAIRKPRAAGGHLPGESEVAQASKGANMQYIFSKHGKDNVFCYFIEDGSSDFCERELELSGDCIVAGCDINDCINVFAVRDNKVYYCCESDCANGEFGAEEELDFDWKEGDNKISRIIIRQLEEGFVLGIVTYKDTPVSYNISCYFRLRSVMKRIVGVNFLTDKLVFTGNEKSEVAVEAISNLYFSGYYSCIVESDDKSIVGIDLPDSAVAKKLVSAPDNTVFAHLTGNNGREIIGIVEKTDGNPIFKKIIEMEEIDDFDIAMHSVRDSAYQIAVLAKQTLYHADIAKKDDSFLVDELCPMDSGILAFPKFHRCMESDSLVYIRDRGDLIAIQQNMDTGIWNELCVRSERSVFSRHHENAGNSCDTIRTKPSYSTEITFLHPTLETPLVDLDVEIWTDSKTFIQTAQGLKCIDSKNRLILNTGGSGTIYFVQETDDIAVSEVWYRILDSSISNENQVYCVRQYEVVHKELKDVTSEQLMDAKITNPITGAEDYFLENKFRKTEYTDDTARCIRELFSAADSLAAAANTSASATESIGAGSIAAQPSYNKSWTLSFSNSGAEYTEYNGTVIGLAQAGANNANEISVSLSSFTRAVEKGFFEIKSISLNPVERSNGFFSALIVFVSENATKFCRWVVEKVSEIYSLVKSVFAKIKVGFDKLCKYIGFVFNWKDILYTKDAISGTLDSLFDSLGSFIGDYKESLLDEIDSAKEKLSETIDNLTKDGNIYANLRSKQPSLDEKYELAVSNDILLRKMQNIDEMDVDTSFLSSRSNAIDIVDEITRILDGVSAADDFIQAKNCFLREINSIEDLFSNIMNGLLKALEGLAKLVLDAFKAIVSLVLDLADEIISSFRSVIEEKINVPFFTELYVLITGNEPSIKDICSLIVAAPTTVLHKLIEGKAPFRNQDDVRSYCEWYTQGSASPANASDDVWEVVKSYILIVASTSYCVVSIASDALFIASRTKTIPSMIKTGVSFAALVLNWIWLLAGKPKEMGVRGDLEFQTVFFLFFTTGCIVDIGLTFARLKFAVDEMSSFFPMIFGFVHTALASIGFRIGKLNVPEFTAEMVVVVMELTKPFRLIKKKIAIIAVVTDAIAAIGVLAIGIFKKVHRSSISTSAVEIESVTISGIKASIGGIVDSITFINSDGSESKIGGDGGNPSAVVMLKPGEHIISVDYKKSSYFRWDGCIGYISFKTNLGETYTFKPPSNPHTETISLSAPEGKFIASFKGNAIRRPRESDIYFSSLEIDELGDL